MDLPTRQGTLGLVAGLLATSLAAQARPADWPTWGRDPGNGKYSPLTQIRPENVDRLRLAWTWRTGEVPMEIALDGATPARPGMFQATPIAINDTVYLTTPYNQLVALDGATGRQLWRYDPGSARYGQPPNGTGFVHRGVAAWSDDQSRRIFLNTRWRLIALDAATGKPILGFGANGEIDLTEGLLKPVNKLHYTNTSPPVVYRDLVIVGNGVADRLVYSGDPRGEVQAFDVRTGRRVWVFDPIPGPGELGNETWEDGSWRTTGHTNVWAPMSLDERRGLLYLPVSTPSNDFYGGNRKGDNLFAESVVCLDAATGQRKWHYQIVRHGVWDYDLPSGPTLITIGEGATAVDAVVQLTKQGMAFAFHRVSGAPIWPIEDRPVPESRVPGERLAKTQPFPTRPAPFSPQGFSEADAADFTPALKRLALKAIRGFDLGPIYSAPSFRGLIMRPGLIGGAGWGGGAYDPTTGTLFVKATNNPALVKLTRPAKSPTVIADITADLSAELRYPDLSLAERRALGGSLAGLPLHKPPYGTMTAIDMKSGEHRWTVTAGDSPPIRNHPALEGLALPRLGATGAPGPIVTASGLIFLTGGGQALEAYRSDSGELLWSADLGANGYANPMTYATRDGRQFVAIATGTGADAVLKVFSLP
ncbi:MAG: pyrroloquinoline quinone-dependent dehydrogenase [Gemmatimonadetes bacterium]|nr:pyrroloquinoline quinone-dependent dehydrogenase [Gemmatimonadota bacterium]